MADTKEKEVREQQEKVVKIIDHKDTEKRQFDWAIIGTASAVPITFVEWDLLHWVERLT